jgi:NSS family neurotransmitter:Na+ symporter
MRIPEVFKFIIKYVTPAFLLIIFTLFMLQNVFGWNYSFSDPQFNPTGYVRDLIGGTDADGTHVAASPVARLSVGWIVIMTAFTLFLVNIAGKNWDRQNQN